MGRAVGGFNDNIRRLRSKLIFNDKTLKIVTNYGGLRTRIK